jgi:hypothetical protein
MRPCITHTTRPLNSDTVPQDMASAVRPALVVSRYNELWLQLSSLVRQTGTAMCYTYGFYVLYLFLMITTCLYGLISCLTNGIEPRIVYLVGDSVITGTELFIVCDSANSVTREVTAVSYLAVKCSELPRGNYNVLPSK